MIEKGMHIFCAGGCDEQYINAAKDYIKKYGLTVEDVALRINRTDELVYIVAKKDIELCVKQ